MRLELDSLTHRYGNELAVDDVSFGLESGELVTLLGPSGCGKTTIVQAIAGHIHPTAGQVLLRGEDVTDVPAESRQVSVVFQQSTLFPHMTVSENVAYGLAARDIELEQRDAVVREYLELVDLQDQRGSYPSKLSGGQQRRVELARALAPQPDLLVLDEPLSALDRTLREQLRDEIARIQRETGVTTLFVTHDQEEAMTLADRLVVMNDSSISGIGNPRTLYESPPTPFIASFLGRSNTFSATVIDQQPLTIEIGEKVFTLNDSQNDVLTGDTITCYVRPKDLYFRKSDSNGANLLLSAEITRIVDIGKHYDVTVRIDTGDELIVECAGNPPAIGESLSLALSEQQMTVFGSV